jgi:hypothetical protein
MAQKVDTPEYRADAVRMVVNDVSDGRTTSLLPGVAAMMRCMGTTKSAWRHWHANVREWQRSQPAGASPIQPSPEFVEARIVEDQAPPSRGGVIVLELRDGLQVRPEPGLDPAPLLQLVDALGASA